MSEWESYSIERIFSELKTSKLGLSSSEAKDRLRKYGKNALKEEKKLTGVKIFLSQFKSPLVILLIVATTIALFIQNYIDAAVIGVIVIVNALFGFLQEYKAEKAMLALKKLAAPTAIVLRDGQKVQISAEELVPGDIILLNTGDKVPADARLLEAVNLQVNESSLTGESVPVHKRVAEVEGSDLALRFNMIYASTAIMYGHGIAIVVQTAMSTEIGKIAESVSQIEEKRTPLMSKLSKFSKVIGISVAVMAGVIFLLNYLRGIALFDSFLNALALAVAAVPEGLPAVVTITLAIGIKAMAKKQAVVRKLSIAETLGSATIIATDKTGTLTENEMTVQMIYSDNKRVEVTGTGYEPKGKFLLDGKQFSPNENKVVSKLLEVGKLCNLSSLVKSDRDWKIIGNPTEGALLVAAQKANIISSYPKIGEISFDSTRKMMTTIHQSNKLAFAAVKGAPEVVLSKCKFIYEKDKIRKITKADVEKIGEIEKSMASSALRVLGLAFKNLNPSEKNKLDSENVEKDLVFLGMVGMIDPPRPEVHSAIAKCRDAGIRIIMITGDNQDTALAIAKQTGLYSNGHIILGEAIDKMSDGELSHALDETDIFARVSPEHKSRIVNLLQKKGHIVAVTGDGVNDAPALKSADIGVAMGVRGTDVAKEASDIVLKDDNFASIVTAIEEGRRIYGNIKKFVRYLLSCNLGVVVFVFMAALINLPLPLIAVQILLMNLLTDGLPALALGADEVSKDAMKVSPTHPKEKILSRQMVPYMLSVGALIGFGSLALFYYTLSTGLGIEQARSVAFSAVVMFQIFNVFNAREELKSILHSGRPSNWLLGAVASSVIIMFAIMYIPVLAKLFRVVPLSFGWLGITILVASSVIVIVELEKVILRRRVNA